MEKIYVVSWLESERGWGVRPDGYSVHKSLEDYAAYMKNYWANMPDTAPDEYSRPSSNPEERFVNKRAYDRISNHGLRFWNKESLNEFLSTD